MKPQDIAYLAMQNGIRGDAIQIAVAISLAESGGNETAVSPKNADGTIDVGLWQINSTHKTSHPTWTSEWLKVPSNNAKAMATLSGNGSKWTDWVAYTNGKYKNFMKTAEGAVAIAAVEHGNIDFHPGDIVDAASDVISGATSTFDAMKDIASAALSFIDLIGKGVAWITDSNNWLRVTQVGGGVALALIAATIVAKPVIVDVKETVSP